MTDPFERFTELYRRALGSDIREPTAMALATASPEGRPSVRIVLLKSFDRHGFVFYTNLESRKAADLRANPHAALCFHWQPLEVQVRVEGSIEQVPDAEADAYFESRPRGSQIGAWASLQSRPLESRADLDARVAEIEARFASTAVTRPPFWSGFRLLPERMEFWSGKPSRLHERDVYRLEADGSWSLGLLYP